MDTVIVLFVSLAVTVGIGWLFYLWGASIAQGKGRSRSLGWLAVFFGLIGIIFLYMLSDDSIRTPIAASGPSRDNISGQLEQLANLRDRGALTAEEFEQRKRALLAQ